MSSPSLGAAACMDGEVSWISSQAVQSRSTYPYSVQADRFFSPPPPPQDHDVPPVPPIPRHVFRMRRRPPSFPSFGVIRPNQEPFPFEANIRFPTPPFPEPAPPPHHVPAMSFGGAIISLNRQLLTEERARHQDERRRRGQIMRQFSHRYRAAIQQDDEPFAQLFASEQLDDMGFGHVDNLRNSRKKEPQYLPSFTHPGRPAPGFTFDFAPPSPSSSPKISTKPPVIDVDEDPVASTSALRVEEASTLLVCARCLDPLVLGGGNDGRKLWALRCGHLIDGKCLEEIMVTPPAAEDHGKAVKENAETARTAKGKEVVTSDESSLTTQSPESAEPDYPELKSMRSRLRPRHSASHSTPAPVAGPSIPAPRRSAFRRAMLKHQHRLPQSKGKGKIAELLVVNSYEWSCPVSGCGRVHVSLLVGGRWVPDGERGAIAVYV